MVRIPSFLLFSSAAFLALGLITHATAQNSGNKKSFQVFGYSHEKPPYMKGTRMGANGTQLKTGQKYNSAAADWSVLPLGSVFKVPGYGNTYFVVDDHLPELVGKTAVKIYFDKPKDAQNAGSQWKEIEILRVGDFKNAYLKLREQSSSQRSSYLMAQAIFQKFEEERKRLEAERQRQMAAQYEAAKAMGGAADGELPSYVLDPIETPKGTNLLFPTSPTPGGTNKEIAPGGELPALQAIDPIPEKIAE